MPTIKPFRTVDEHDCINGLFAYSGTVPVEQGTFVKIVSGFDASQFTSLVGTAGYDFAGTESVRWGLPAQVTACNGTGDAAIGMLLYSVKEVDENGEKLIYKPRKAIENNWTISGCGVNIVTKGVFLYSGVAGTVTVGANAYLGTDGGLNVSGSASSVATKVGKFLGPKDSNGVVLFKLEL